MENDLALGAWPTPLHRAENLSADLGIELSLKREDLSIVGLGGNKFRKLIRIFQTIEAGQFDVVVTTGAAQSNHCRMTAAIATRAALPCHLVLRGAGAGIATGNLLLDRLFGANCHFLPSSSPADADEYIENLVAQLRRQGHNPFVIPVGGNSLESVEAFEICAREIAEQTAQEGHPDAIVVAFGSGSTYAGLVLGATTHLPHTSVIGVSVASRIPEARKKLETHLANKDVAIASLKIVDQYVGEGYGVPSEKSRAALLLMARREGVVLDPTYTAKAFAGLLGELESGLLRKGNRVVLVHTGGAPAIFAATPEELAIESTTADVKRMGQRT